MQPALPSVIRQRAPNAGRDARSTAIPLTAPTRGPASEPGGYRRLPPSENLITSQPTMPRVGELPAISDATNQSKGPGIGSGFPASGAGKGSGLVTKTGIMGSSVAALRGGHDGGFIGESRK